MPYIPELDDYESGCPTCGEDAMNGNLCFSCDRQRQIDNYDFSGWVFCPNCQTIEVTQHDWRKPIYDCRMCSHHWTDPEGEWIESEY